MSEPLFGSRSNAKSLLPVQRNAPLTESMNYAINLSRRLTPRPSDASTPRKKFALFVEGIHVFPGGAGISRYEAAKSLKFESEDITMGNWETESIDRERKMEVLKFTDRLRAAGVTKVTVSYSGDGDEGFAEPPEFQDASDKPIDESSLPAADLEAL